MFRLAYSRRHKPFRFIGRYSYFRQNTKQDCFTSLAQILSGSGHTVVNPIVKSGDFGKFRAFVVGRWVVWLGPTPLQRSEFPLTVDP